MVTPSKSIAPLLPSRDTQADRRVVTRAMWIGMWVWPSFTVLDAYMCFVAYPGANFGHFLVYRAVVELAFFGVYWASRHTAVPLKRLYKWQNLGYGAAALAISLMALELGGIRSPYMHGISVVALVRAALVPTHWRRSLKTYGRIWLSFPLVITAAIVVSPQVRADWLTRDALVFFSSHYVFVISSALLGLITGHTVWRTQQQLYQARRLGRYRLQAPIGKGGMGEVWLAWDQALGRNVALKILRTAVAPSVEALKRFEREAQAAGQLRGPHVVQIFDFGASDDGLYYIAMEYLQGMDLATLVDRFGPLPPARAIHVAMQACLALEEAHDAGIIHRDIKPHNLFMTRVGDDPDFVKLLDFGIVRLREPTSMSGDLTWTGVVVGTPAYIAPELMDGAPADERSDVYALGVTLHVLITGRSPFEAYPGGRMPAGLDVDAAYANVRSHDVKAPPDFAPILLRCLQNNPDDRIQSARELYDALAGVYDPGAWTRDDAQTFWRAAERDRLGLPEAPGVR
jgi:serine/threonine-protein kinase